MFALKLIIILFFGKTSCVSVCGFCEEVHFQNAKIDLHKTDLVNYVNTEGESFSKCQLFFKIVIKLLK